MKLESIFLGTVSGQSFFTRLPSVSSTSARSGALVADFLFDLVGSFILTGW